MAKKYAGQEVKPIEQWTPKEWEAAYNLLNERFEKLKNKMRQALNYLSMAQQKLSEAVV